MKLLKNNTYLLLIDEEAEVCRGQYRLFNDKVEFIHEGYNYPYKGYKIIACYPLTDEAKELDLPLLPKFPKEDFTELNKVISKEQDFWYNKTGSITAIEIVEQSVSIGYKAAQSKQFSLEDMKKSFHVGRLYQGREGDTTFESFIQSLSTQQLPKEFIPKFNKNTYIINSEGKEELVGTYKY